MKLRNLMLTGLAALVIGAGSSKAQEVYDDFSSGSLNTGKWTESGFFEEHLVRGGVYHTHQINPGNAEFTLKINRQFLAGETLEHDVNYVSGEGNQQFQYLFNESTWAGGYTWEGVCSTPSPGCNGIGYWNGETDVGIQKGVYHRKLDFLEDRIIVTTTRPNGTQIVHTAISDGTPFLPPYTVRLIPHTGYDGVTNFDFDNFIISQNPVPSEEKSWGQIKALYKN